MHIRNHLPIAYRLKSIVRSSPNISQKKKNRNQQLKQNTLWKTKKKRTEQKETKESN
jgi:hypothetical protein